MGSRLASRITVAMILILMLAGQTAFGAGEQISDVPESHWAYQGVKKLVQEGYLAVYEDGTFQGQRPVDRYTLASVVGRMLVEIEKGQLGVTQADLDLLRQLSTEFRDELVRWYNEKQNLGAAVADTQQRVQVMDDTITRVIDTMEQEDATTRRSIQEQAAAILAEIGSIRQEMNATTQRLDATDRALADQLTQQGKELRAVGDKLDIQTTILESTASTLADTDTAVQANTAKLKEHALKLAVQGDSLAALEEAVGVKVQSRFAEREAALSLLQSELEIKDAELASEINRVEVGLAEAAQQLINVEDKLVAWQKASSQRNEELTVQIDDLGIGLTQLQQALEEEIQARTDKTDTLVQDVDRLEEQLVKQAEALVAADGQLMQDVTGLRQDLVRSLEAVQTDLISITDRITALDKRTAILQQGAAADSRDLADLKEYVSELQGYVITLQDRLAVTEDKIATIDEKLATESSAQLSAS
ncbi:MAG: hypothetical protein GX354_02675, partial [Firmicutes bacterium]|nr:hypothetical protein [Bacillota bacterium]